MKHPIYNYYASSGVLEFDKLYDDLRDNVESGHINHKIYGDLELFDYSRSCTYDGAWNNATRIARGLVLCKSTCSIVSLPFPKFFNYPDEHNRYSDETVDIGNSDIYEKMDGSMIVVSYFRGEWLAHTRGSLESDQAIWATEMLKNHPTNYLNKDISYIFEGIYRDNQIVVNYQDREELCLLGAYNNHTFDEINPYELDEISNSVGFTRPEKFNFNSIDDILENTKTLSKDEEGYVVNSNGVRVKIKGDEYCRIHKILSHHSPLTVWETLRDQGLDSMVEYKLNLPEEFWEETDEWVDTFITKLDNSINNIKLAYQPYKTLSDKDLGLTINSNTDLLYSKWFFNFRKDENFGEVGSKTRKNLFEVFKPKSNIMDYD